MALTDTELEPAFRISELSRVWGISRSALYRRMRSGELKSIKLGGTRLVTRTQAFEFLENGLDRRWG
jgi:excisionase family DNA binding protein